MESMTIAKEMMPVYLILLSIIMTLISNYLYDHVIERVKNDNVAVIICIIGIICCVIALYSVLYAIVLILGLAI